MRFKLSLNIVERVLKICNENDEICKNKKNKKSRVIC